MSKAEKKKCPNCKDELQVMLFMGVEPDFYTCKRCKQAYDLGNLKPLAQVI